MTDQHLYALYTMFGAYALLLATAAAFDVVKFIIPNPIAVSLVALFLVAAMILPFDTDWLSHAGAALAVFVVGVVSFRFRVLGAGDVMLMTAVALWAGFDLLPWMRLYIALAGGALALALVALRHLATTMAIHGAWPGGAVPRLLYIGEKIPYGVAIAAGAIIVGSEHPYLGLFL